MRTWQKAIRSVLQIANGYLGFFRILDIISTLTVIIDREQRRSVYDLAARTVVVIGEPAEDEPESARQQSRMAAWFGQLTRKEQAGLSRTLAATITKPWPSTPQPSARLLFPSDGIQRCSGWCRTA